MVSSPDRRSEIYKSLRIFLEILIFPAQVESQVEFQVQKNSGSSEKQWFQAQGVSS